MEADYERSATFTKSLMQSYLEKIISFHWIEESSAFWYRKEIAPDHFTFHFVDPGQDVYRLAFDHEELAKALKGQGIDAEADALPFDWIDPNGDGSSFKFRAGEKKWQFCGKGCLTEYEGDIKEERLQPMRKEQPSESSDQKTAITFKNNSKERIALLWIDWNGDAKHYATVEAGQSDKRPTYVRHVWRVANSETDQSIASFISQDHDSIVIIEDGMQAITEIVQRAPEEGKCQEIKNTNTYPGSSRALQTATECFVQDCNVWVRDADGQESQLSSSGTRDNPFEKETYPSPDGRFAVVYQYTPEQNHTVYEVESSPKDRIQPRLKQFQYLKPGDKVRVDRPRMFDLVEKKEITTDDSLFQSPYRIDTIGWSIDGREYRFLYNHRGHQVLRVVGMNTQGSIRCLIEETSKTFINYAHKLYSHVIKGADEVIWASERDGWNHLYLFDLKSGKIKNQITKGEWVVRSVTKIDEENRRIWIRALGRVKDQDPYYAQLVRVNFDGSSLKTLTEGDGTHVWTLSPDGKYLIDTWSRVDLAPRTILRDAETGKPIKVLAEATFTKLLELTWEPAERFAAPGRDGETTIYGIIVRPSGFNENKKYPVIEQIYAGPQDFFVPKAFSKLVKQHELAELGFVVVQIDGMGTNWRSKAFHDHCYKDLKDAGLPDRIAWMKEASKSRPWMDLSKVGITGISAGAQNAMAAMLWHSDFYKAAVADSGCHDNRMDKIWWNEQWMGWPIDQSYENSSTVVHAGMLKGALMLIVGELDTNVDPSTTMQVVNALNNAGKDYDLLFIPGGEHGAGSATQYGIRRQQDFFVRHLMGIKPPNRNAGGSHR